MASPKQGLTTPVKSPTSSRGSSLAINPSSSPAASPRESRDTLTDAQKSQVNMLILLLKDKEPKNDGTIEAECLVSNLKEIRELVFHLLAHPDKISVGKVAIMQTSNLSKLDSKRKLTASEAARMETFDPAKVRRFVDVPHLWLWSFLRSRSTKPISDAVVKNMSKKSQKNLRIAMHYFTGRHI